MSKYCPICKRVTNCADNCESCMEEEKKNEELMKQKKALYEDLLMEQQEQM